MDKSDEITQINRTWSDYLHMHGLRNTPERRALLEAICLIDGLFTPESLSDYMRESRNFMVSRATVYNNLQHFIQAGLVRKVLMAGDIRYERAWNRKSCIRLACTNCGTVTETSDDKVRRQIEDLRKKRFTMTGWTLNVYGLCGKCAAALKRRQKKMMNKNSIDKK